MSFEVNGVSEVIGSLRAKRFAMTLEVNDNS